MMQRFVAVGRLVRDADLRYGSSGTPYLRGRVAIGGNGRAQDGKDDTLFMDFVLFGAQAEAVAPYTRQGRMVGLDGRLRARSWEGDNGRTRTVIEIVADRLQLLGGRPKEEAPADDASDDSLEGLSEGPDSGSDEVTAPF